MKVIIKNWGPIERCEYDFDKSMIVTYGDNNIGKSYAMQAAYLVLKNLIFHAEHTLRGFLTYIGEDLDKVIENILIKFYEDKEKTVEDITNDILKMFERDLTETLIPELENSFRNTFGNFDLILEKNPSISVILDNDSRCIFCMMDKKILVEMNTKLVNLKKTDSDFHKSRDNKTHYDIYLYKNQIKTPMSLIEEKLAEIRHYFATNILSTVHKVYFLPASRSGIYTGMSSFGPILAQLSQNRAYFRGTLQIPSISEPVSDYYMELSTIRADRKTVFDDIAKELEDTILNGEVIFDSKKKTIAYKSHDTDQIVEMTDASSMVSEISPITAYLKYIIKSTFSYPRRYRMLSEKKPVHIIFIEEPEAHLHPSKQVALMKIFVKLVQKNVKLVMASHSNYVFNELNNRVIAGELDEKSYSPILMKYENGRSNTYHMEMDELGVSDENFADIAEQIYEEREELVCKLVKKMENQRIDQ